MEFPIKHIGKFNFIESGNDGPTLLLLHGLFGALSNFRTIIEHFGEKINVVVPILPIFEMPLRKVSVSGLVDHVQQFVKERGYDRIHVLGNSLGGHIALLFALKNPEIMRSVTLTASSGLFESGLGSTFPKRSNYEYVRNSAQAVFYDPTIATKELVDEVFETINNRNKAIRLIAMAKSALRHNLADRLHNIKVPTLLVWGKNDHITPPFVAEKFDDLISDSELHILENCGHAPMMELPHDFNRILERFLDRISAKKSLAI